MKSLKTIFIVGIFVPFFSLQSCVKWNEDEEAGPETPPTIQQSKPVESDVVSKPSDPVVVLEDKDNDFLTSDLDQDDNLASIPNIKVSIIRSISMGLSYYSSNGSVKKSQVVSEGSNISRNIMNQDDIFRKNKVTEIFSSIESTKSNMTYENNYQVMTKWPYSNLKKVHYELKGKELLQDSGIIHYKINLSLHEVKYITKIENINYSIGYFHDGNFVEIKSRLLTKNEFELLDLRVNPDLNEQELRISISSADAGLEVGIIKHLIDTGGQLAFRINNFDFTRLGKTYNIEEVKNKVGEATNTLVINTPDYIKKYTHTYKGTLAEVLSKLGYATGLNTARNFKYINEYQSTLTDVLTYSDYVLSSGDKAKWFLNSESALGDTLDIDEANLLFTTVDEIRATQETHTLITEDVTPSTNKDILSFKLNRPLEFHVSIEKIVPKHTYETIERNTLFKCKKLWPESGFDPPRRIKSIFMKSNFKMVTSKVKFKTLDDLNLMLVDGVNETPIADLIKPENLFINNETGSISFVLNLDSKNKKMKIYSKNRSQLKTFEYGFIKKEVPGLALCEPLEMIFPPTSQFSTRKYKTTVPLEQFKYDIKITGSRRDK